jgi:hypothetical protein
MTADSDDWFADACEKPFAFLVQRFGFSGPTQSRPGGNEFVVRYQRKKKTVSISIEPFGRPVVELFYPSIDLKHRSFPPQSPLPSAKGLSEEEELARELHHCATELESKAHDFLSHQERA